MLIAFCWPNLGDITSESLILHGDPVDRRCCSLPKPRRCRLTPKNLAWIRKKPTGWLHVFWSMGFFFVYRISSWDPPVLLHQGSGPVYVVIANMKLVASPNLHWVWTTGHYEILQLFVGFGNEDFIIWVWSLTQQQWLVPGLLHFGCGLSQGHWPCMMD